MNFDVCRKCCEKNGNLIDKLYITVGEINFISRKPITKTTKIDFYACVMPCDEIPLEYNYKNYYQYDTIQKILNHFKIPKRCPYYMEHLLSEWNKNEQKDL